MRLSRTSIQKAVAGVALGTGLVAANNTSAALVYDLRFADGSKTKQAAAGTYTVDLWAQVSGTNGVTTDDGVFSSYVKILSTQGSTPGITAGGLATGAVSTDFQSFTGTSPLHRNGSASDLNGDGIIDWGASVNSSADTNYMLARATGVVTGGGSVGQSVNVNTWEFKLATFTINVTAADANGTTLFNVVKPNATAVTAVTYSTARVDGANFNVQSTNQQGAYTGSSGISFAPLVPEPTSLGLLGVAAVGLIGRRRKH